MSNKHFYGQKNKCINAKHITKCLYFDLSRKYSQIISNQFILPLTIVDTTKWNTIHIYNEMSPAMDFKVHLKCGKCNTELFTYLIFILQELLQKCNEGTEPRGTFKSTL